MVARFINYSLQYNFIGIIDIPWHKIGRVLIHVIGLVFGSSVLTLPAWLSRV